MLTSRDLSRTAFIAALLSFGVRIGWAGVIQGIVEDVDATKRTITLKIPAKNTSQTFQVRASAAIMVDGKTAGFNEIAAGQTVSITSNKTDEATQIAAKPPQQPVKQETTRDRGTGHADWPQFRGPNRDNISHETGLLSRWPEGGPSLAWKQSNIGLGYSTVAVAQGKVYTMGNRGNDEYLLALDESSGEHLWAVRTGDAYHDGMGDGPRGTPTVDDDRVYALGGNGDLICVSAAEGDVLWRTNILKEFGGRNIQWGISESVLIDGDQLICTPGGKEATLVALQKLTGKLIWRSKVAGAPQAAYSSPIAVVVGDVRQYVTFVHTSVVGINSRDGQPLWSNPKSANGTANCSTPLFAKNAIFSASGYGTGGALVKLTSSKDDTKSTLAYHTPRMKNHHGGMVAIDGCIYGFDEDVLTCLDWETGKEKWRNRSVGKGSLTVAGGHFYLRSENGPVALAAVSPKKYVETGRFDQPQRSNKPSWAHPVVANGRLFLRDMDTLLVYRVKE